MHPTEFRHLSPASRLGPKGDEKTPLLKVRPSRPSLRRFVAAIVLLGLLVSDRSIGFGEDLSQRRVELKKIYDASRSGISEKSEKLRSELGEKFVGALQKLESDLQEKGKLEELLVVRKEREEFVKSGNVGSEGLPELIRLRAVFLESRAPIDENEKVENDRLVEAYLKQLETLQTDLTRGGDIDTALKVKEEADRLQQSLELGKASASGADPGASNADAPGTLEPIPAMEHAPVGEDLFKQEKWPLKIALPTANYRIEKTLHVESEKGREMLLLPGSVFRGADETSRWNVGNAQLVAREVEFNGFKFHGDLSSRLFFEKCLFKDMLVGKGGGWFGGRFMSRWQFRDCRIEGSFLESWQSKLFGLQMVNCHVERVEFPAIEYDTEDEPSHFAGQAWATVKDTHFRKCVIPVSVLSLLENCTFEGCRFVDDPTPLVFATPLKRTVYLEDCQWNVKSLPAQFLVEQKKLSEKR